MQKKRNTFKVIIIILGLVIVWFAYQYINYNQVLKTPIDSSDTSSVSFIVKKGENVESIASNLAAKKIIREEDKNILELYARLNNIDRNIIPGRFVLQRSMTIPEIMKVLIDHEQNEIVLTIPEGSTIKEIDEKLTDLELIESGEFIAATRNFDDYETYPFLSQEEQKELPYPLEGYLFPDTYFIDESSFTVEQVLNLMLQTFEKKAYPLLSEKGKDLHDHVIMASILEKEVNTSPDIPVVAGILWKRLENDWTLGADATLLYLADDRDITYQDLQKDDAYNTRLNKGLPLGPIGNPGVETIKAAVNPEDSSYWFYLTDSEGAVIYARTNDEHNSNKQEYL